MSEKRGRPKKAIARREKNIGFFVTNDQYALIQRKAEQATVNISDYMRQVAIAGEVRARWTVEERDMVRKLIGMSADLHRLAEGSQAAALGAEDPASPLGVLGAAGIGSSDVGVGAPAVGAPGASQLGVSGVGAEFFKQFRDELDIIIKHLCHDR